MTMILEICANSYQSAINAEKAGAHRIELCSELFIGGITPSFALLEKVMRSLTLPVHVLIRPRSGGFTYTDVEFELMKESITQCKEKGCAGIVAGILNSNHTVDVKRTQELISLSNPLSFTFHRAFDTVPNPKESLIELIELGVDRVLTSGQQKKAEDGIALIAELQKMAKEALVVMPGSGITAENCLKFKNIGCREIHCSASKVIDENTPSYFSRIPHTVSDVDGIKKILKRMANG